MASYCQVSDVRIALVDLGNTDGDTNTAADLADATIQSAIDEASAIVDVHIGGTYSDPTGATAGSNPAAPIVLFWARDIAAFLAACTYRKSKDFAQYDPVLLRYQQAYQDLAGISTGATVLPPGMTPDVLADPTTANPYDFTLMNPWQYDLTGRSESGWGPYSGYPVWRLELVTN